MISTFVAFVAAALLRWRPLVSTGLLLAATVAQTQAWRANVQLPLPSLLAVGVALCVITAVRPRRTARAAAAMAVGVVFGHLALMPAMGGGLFHTGASFGTSDAGLVVILLAWLVGDTVRLSRERVEMVGRARDHAELHVDGHR